MSGWPNNETILWKVCKANIHSKFKFRDNWSASTLADPAICAADNQIPLAMAQLQIV
jgi:hypothetical protein